jgi:hypothetical protein
MQSGVRETYIHQKLYVADVAFFGVDDLFQHSTALKEPIQDSLINDHAPCNVRAVLGKSAGIRSLTAAVGSLVARRDTCSS